MKLSRRQLGTVLAALRFYQADLEGRPVSRAELSDIASDGNELEPLTVVEIDQLCEHINSKSNVVEDAT